MRRPPGMADAGAALEPGRQARPQARDAGLGLVHAQSAGPVRHGEPGGVIPAVFELGQPLQQDGHTIPASHMRNDPAHFAAPSLGPTTHFWPDDSSLGRRRNLWATTHFWPDDAPRGQTDAPLSRRRHDEAAAATTAAESLAWPVARPRSPRKPARS